MGNRWIFYSGFIRHEHAGRRDEPRDAPVAEAADRVFLKAAWIALAAP